MANLGRIAGILSLGFGACASLAQAEPRPSILHDPGNGRCAVMWDGEPGMVYLVQTSEDLVAWRYRPELLSGTGGPLSVTFDAAGEREFVRLRSVVWAGGDPATADFDSDGITNGDELALGCDPLAPDTDADGIVDGAELTLGNDPLVANDYGPVLGVAGARLYLRADLGIVLDANGAVARWRDLSGRGNDAVQTRTDRRPSVVAAQVNGLPVVRFTQQPRTYFSLPNLLADATGGEVFAVVRKTSVAYTGLWAFGTGGGCSYAAPDLGVSDDFASASSSAAGKPATDLSQYHRYNVGGDAAGWFQRINEREFARRDTNTVGFRTNPTLGWSGSSAFDGDIEEVIVFDRVLTPGERAAVGRYLIERTHDPLSESYPLMSPQAWETTYQRLTQGVEPYLDPARYNNNFGVKFAWESGYRLRGYVAMARLTGQTMYLDRAGRLIDFMMSQRDPERVARGELTVPPNGLYSYAPPEFLEDPAAVHPGWIDNTRISALTDGQICNHIMDFVETVLGEARFAAHVERANGYLETVRQILATHDSEFIRNRYVPAVPGSYYYYALVEGVIRCWSNPVPFNHSATILEAGMAVDRVTGDTRYHALAADLVGYFKYYATLDNGAYQWRYSPWEEVEKGVHFNSGSPGGEDFEHGNVDLGFLVAAFRDGVPGLTADDMQRLAATLTTKVRLGRGSLARYVDGTSTKWDGTPAPLNDWDHGKVALNWLALAEFDPSIVDLAEEEYVARGFFPTGDIDGLGWANLMAWRRRIPLPPPSGDPVD